MNDIPRTTAASARVPARLRPDARLVPAFLRDISGRVFTQEIMMSKHGDDKKRRLQATPSNREGDKG
ncbi:MAG TPA: hypothetical protein VKP69_20785, partial [Isosphaeraceae bacterium]|nr:hypothetical protein [Isosphaeraceae bacterium]